MLSSFFAIVAAFTTVPTAPRGSVARGAPVMSLDRRQALRLSLGSAVLAGVPLASHATATADGGNQELDNSAMRFNNKNLGGITDYKGADDTEAAMAKIAQRNREAQEEQERRRLAQFRSKTQAEVDAEIEAEKAKSKNLILGIAGGGTLLSGVFIVPNLRRLGIKIASGGADRGYDSVPEPKRAVKRGVKKAEKAVVDPFANSPFRSRRFEVSKAVDDDDEPPPKRFGLF